MSCSGNDETLEATIDLAPQGSFICAASTNLGLAPCCDCVDPSHCQKPFFHHHHPLRFAVRPYGAHVNASCFFHVELVVQNFHLQQQTLV